MSCSHNNECCNCRRHVVYDCTRSDTPLDFEDAKLTMMRIIFERLEDGLPIGKSVRFHRGDRIDAATMFRTGTAVLNMAGVLHNNTGTYHTVPLSMSSEVLDGSTPLDFILFVADAAQKRAHRKQIKADYMVLYTSQQFMNHWRFIHEKFPRWKTEQRDRAVTRWSERMILLVGHTPRE